MQHVWILSYINYDDFEIIGVFKDRQSAEEYIKSIEKSYIYPQLLSVDQHEVKG